MQLKQLTGLGYHKGIKVAHCASGLVGSFALGCGIRLTPLGVEGRQLIPHLMIQRHTLFILRVTYSVTRTLS